MAKIPEVPKGDEAVLRELKEHRTGLFDEGMRNSKGISFLLPIAVPRVVYIGLL